MRKISKGFFCTFKGIKLLFSAPGLLKWSLIPWIIDAALVIGVLTWAWGSVAHWVQVLLAWLVAEPSGFLFSTLYYFLFGAAYLAVAVLMMFLTFALATVVASPFHSLLAEQTLIHLGALESRPFQVRRWLATSSKMFLVSLIKVVVFALAGGIIFLLSFVPVLNLLAAALAMMIMAFDVADFSLEAKAMGFSARMKFYSAHFWEFVGLGAFFALSLSVPGLTLLLLPAAVVGSCTFLEGKEP